MTEYNKKEKDLGALWIRQNSKVTGGKMMTGYVEIDGKKTKIVCFVNGYKKEDKHPDWVIRKSIEKTEYQKGAEQVINNNEPQEPVTKSVTSDVAIKDVPF